MGRGGEECRWKYLSASSYSAVPEDQVFDSAIVSLASGTHFERSALFVLSGSDCCDSIELLSNTLYITGDRARAFFAVADALWDDALSICDIIEKSAQELTTYLAVWRNVCALLSLLQGKNSKPLFWGASLWL
ncbi:hypothetical protein [Microcoleus sp. CAWBG58]|uniref:hypothetical protein n=1 Tax=Microcoleus sp. CAWBG58 TaxID=2841651 RepID=UPI0025E18798|nr:hypothetical protein [Microcoleus sp. CAWBG58]